MECIFHKFFYKEWFEMNKNLLACFLGVLLVFCMGFIGCASTAPANYDSIIADTTPTKFEGMWGHLNPNFSDAKILFSGNSFMLEWDDENVKGRYSFDSRKIYFFVEDGQTWTVSYKLQNIELWLTRLTNVDGGFQWYHGKFYKNVKKTFKKDNASDADFLVAKKLRDDAAALFFYDIDNDGNLDNGPGNTVKGENELGGVCSDYAMELARLAEQQGLECYIVTSGHEHVIGKVTKWLDTNTYTFRVRKGKDFGVNNAVDGHYDGVYRDADFTAVKQYAGEPPHVYGEAPDNHMWNIVIINNRTFVIDATQFDEWSGKRNEGDYIAYIIEVEGGL
jgi:hypothetical protein